MLLVTGATGFVGRHAVTALREAGIAVRALARDPKKAAGLAALGAEVVRGDILDRASLDRAIAGCDRVLHLVGIIQETGSATFASVHVEGTRNVVAAAKEAGVRHLVFQSALGTRPNAKSAYHRTKWEAEEIVRASGIASTILRPSLLYGPGDGFTTRLAAAIKLSPMLPVIGRGRTKVQPLAIDDAVACIVKAVSSDAYLNELYELGGPEQFSYEAVTIAIAEAIGVRRPVLHLPMPFMRVAARVLERTVPTSPVTQDQLIMLQEDNVCGMQDIRDAFGIEPMLFRDGLRKYFGKPAA